MQTDTRTEAPSGAHASHRFEEHTSEVRVALHAPSLPALFAEAARALAELQAERLPHQSEAQETVTISARDREALLVQWIDELIYRGEISGRVYPEVRFEALDDTHLVATIGGGEPIRRRTAVKAATFHGLHVTPDDGGLQAHVILDV